MSSGGCPEPKARVAVDGRLQVTTSGCGRRAPARCQRLVPSPPGSGAAKRGGLTHCVRSLSHPEVRINSRRHRQACKGPGGCGDNGAVTEDSDAYEELTRHLIGRLGVLRGVTSLRLERNVVLHGKATHHQIDVIWQFKAAGTDQVQTVLFECRHYRDAIKKGRLLEFKGGATTSPPTKGRTASRTRPEPW